MRVSTSTQASMLACGSCRPLIHTTSVRDGATVSGQPPRPEEPEQPKMGLFQTPASRLSLPATPSAPLARMYQLVSIVDGSEQFIPFSGQCEQRGGIPEPGVQFAFHRLPPKIRASR